MSQVSTKGLKWLWDQILELLYPTACLFCDRPMPHGTEAYCCQPCSVSVPPILGERCEICSQPIGQSDSNRCFDCQRHKHAYTFGKSLWLYEGVIKESIHAFKYKNRRDLGLLFAKALARYYNEDRMPVDLIVPVPIHPTKYHKRGYNQAGILGGNFSKLTEMPMSEKVLKRVRKTGPQIALSDGARWRNVEGAFLGHPSLVKGLSILLIDDVYTTGSTIDACAKELLRCGAKDVYFITLAIGKGYE